MAADWQNFIRRPPHWFDTRSFSHRGSQYWPNDLNAPSFPPCQRYYNGSTSGLEYFRVPGTDETRGIYHWDGGSCHLSTGTTIFDPCNEITSLSINPGFVRASPRFLANGVVTTYERRWVYVCGTLLPGPRTTVDGYIFPRIVSYSFE